MTSAAHVPSHRASAADRPTRIAVPVWAWPILLYGLAALFLLLDDNGAVLLSAADTVHEFFHDARHAFGVPCH
jgi:cobalt transporter subunit CbtB